MLSTSFQAAVVRQPGGPFELETVRLNSLQPHEVVVRIVATGMCYTDMVARDRLYPIPQPIVLGHEGAPASCQNFNALYFFGQRHDGSHALCCQDNQLLHDRFFGQSSFAAFAVVDQRNIVKVRPDAPLELLGPQGCGIQTGAGATTIIAIDVVEERLALARELGATHVINSRESDPVKAIRDITGDGVDFSLESTGRPDIVRAGVEALRPRGIVEGDSIPDIFIPQLVELYMQGRFPIDKLMRFYAFDQINQAAADSEHGKTIKPVIRIG
ncbi:TPA: NAD(P)-dependent alcohol dehydrogenase [Klebsiella aerogenes]